jgi:hypothetical protein
VFPGDALVVGQSIAYGLVLRMAEDSSRVRIATSGAVNRLGQNRPAANPTALTATRATAHTAAGHHGGPPQLTWAAVTPYTTATQAR